MMDLIIFLCFIIFMILAVCWIQAIEITQLKARAKYLQKENDYYEEYVPKYNMCCEFHPNWDPDICPETGKYLREDKE